MFGAHGQLMLGHVLQVDAKKQQQIRELDVIDRADAVELVNAGGCVGVFYLSEPCIGNVEFFVPLSCRDPLAPFRDIPRRDAKAGAQVLQLLARPQSTLPPGANDNQKTR